jgi:hypothetical protein
MASQKRKSRRIRPPFGAKNFSGVGPTRKAPAGYSRFVFRSWPELQAFLDLQFSWELRDVCHGEVTPEIAARYKVPMPPDYATIRYEFDEKVHAAHADFVGRFASGEFEGQFLRVQVGVDEFKLGPRDEARFAAERRWAEMNGGVFAYMGDATRSFVRFCNLLWLNRFLHSPLRILDLEARLDARWKSLGEASVNDLIEPFKGEAAELTLVASAWSVVARVAYDRGLTVGYDEIRFTRDVNLGRYAGPRQPFRPWTDSPQAPSKEPPEPTPYGIPGPVLDKALLLAGIPERHRMGADKNIEMVLSAVRDGRSDAEAGKAHGVTDRTVRKWRIKVQKHGWRAAVPFAKNESDSSGSDGGTPYASDVHPRLIEGLRVAASDPSVTEIPQLLRHREYEFALRDARATDPELKEASAGQARRLWEAFNRDLEVQKARRNGEAASRGKRAVTAFRLTTFYPGLIGQADADTEDVEVKIVKGRPNKLRMHGLALVDVTFSMPTGFRLGPPSPKQHELRDLLALAVDDGRKAQLLAGYKVKEEWPSCLFALLVLDQALINLAESVIDFNVDEFGTILMWGPAATPSVRGTVEAIFREKNKTAHSTPGTTLSSPDSRGTYKPALGFAKHGLTADVYEGLTIEALVRVQVHGWDQDRLCGRFEAWTERVAETGLPIFTGSTAILRSLASRVVKRGAMQTFVINDDRTIHAFSRSYTTTENWLDALGKGPVTLKYWEEDISRLLVFDEFGAYRGTVHCTELPYRISEWEWDIVRPRGAAARRTATQGTDRAIREIVSDARAGKKLSRAEKNRVMREQQAATAARDTEFRQIEESANGSAAETPTPTRTDSRFEPATRSSSSVGIRLPITYITPNVLTRQDRFLRVQFRVPTAFATHLEKEVRAIADSRRMAVLIAPSFSGKTQGALAIERAWRSKDHFGNTRVGAVLIEAEMGARWTLVRVIRTIDDKIGEHPGRASERDVLRTMKRCQLLVLLFDEANKMTPKEVEVALQLKERMTNLGWPIGIVFLAAGSPTEWPLRSYFSGRETEERQRENRLDGDRPMVHIHNHKLEEFVPILAAYEDVYRPQFSNIDLVPYAPSIYRWMTVRLVDRDTTGEASVGIFDKVIEAALQEAFRRDMHDLGPDLGILRAEFERFAIGGIPTEDRDPRAA